MKKHIKKMDTVYLQISKNQHLSDILSEIPNNAILNKVLPGLGATHLELLTDRNSIIVEPNRPVIDGKCKKHRNILGVIEGIYTSDIEAYLMNDNITHKKIMTTPESFQKIKQAMENLKINMYKDYFLMFDECDRTVSDIEFRVSITLPMEDFFKFDNKAFVSATALRFSDPRFIHQGFKIFQIDPQFDYSRDLNLIVTNNPLFSLKKLFNESVRVEEQENIFIFLNSTIGIMSFIKQANLQDKCAVFCSKKSAEKIKKQMTIDVYDKINESKFKKVNFFTSRFFSAVDIDITEKPHVFIITDHTLAQHTMIDPYSDLVQIPGRFRNIELASFTYITTYDPHLSGFTDVQSKQYINKLKYAYNTVKTLKDISQDSIYIKAIEDSLTHLPYTDFLNDKGKLNHYMIDGFRTKERIKLCHNTDDALLNTLASEKLKKRFRINHIAHKFNQSSFYPKIGKNNLSKDEVIELLNTLDNIHTNNHEIYCLDVKQDVMQEIEREHPIFVEAYRKLGRDEILKHEGSVKRLKLAILEYDKSIGIKHNFEFMDELNIMFNIGEFYTTDFIKDTFCNLIDKYSLLFNKNRYMKEFQRLFDTSNRTSKKGFKGKGYILTRKRFK